MPSQPKTTIAGQLSAAGLAISNTLADGEIQALVTTYGYSMTKMQEGQFLYDAAVRAVNAQTAAAGAQQHATQQAREHEQRARAAYQALAQVARAVFARSSAHRVALGLVGTAPQSTAGFLAAATTLFDNVLLVAEIRDTLAAYGYNDRRLERERACVSSFKEAHQAQMAAMGAAQQATRNQRAALTALNQWVAQYLKIAKVALRDTPEYVEKLGPCRAAAAPPPSATRPRKPPRRARSSRRLRDNTFHIRSSRPPTNDERRTTNGLQSRWSLVVGRWSLVVGRERQLALDDSCRS